MSTETSRPPISSRLSRVLDHLEGMQALRELDGDDAKKQQLNLRLSAVGIHALEKIAERYDDNRTTVATLLLQAAIVDVCEHLGINWRLYDETGAPLDVDE